MDSGESESLDDGPPNETDKICAVCGKWTTSALDFKTNFLSCRACPQSYHKQCIGIVYRSERINYCHQRKDIRHSPLSCCKELRHPRALWKTLGDTPFCPQSYCYDENESPVYWHPDDKRSALKNERKYKTPSNPDYQLRSVLIL